MDMSVGNPVDLIAETPFPAAATMQCPYDSYAACIRAAAPAAADGRVRGRAPRRHLRGDAAARGLLEPPLRLRRRLDAGGDARGSPRTDYAWGSRSPTGRTTRGSGSSRSRCSSRAPARAGALVRDVRRRADRRASSTAASASSWRVRDQAHRVGDPDAVRATARAPRSRYRLGPLRGLRHALGCAGEPAGGTRRASSISASSSATGSSSASTLPATTSSHSTCSATSSSRAGSTCRT